MFSTITGNFRCVRCKAKTETYSQTHLFDTTTFEAYDCGFGYGIGDFVIIDGLDGEYSLYPYVPLDDLTIVGGDWDCAHCGLGWQWSLVRFVVLELLNDELRAQISMVDSFVPRRPDDFRGVHFVEAELAYFANLDKPFDDLWLKMDVAERCERMVDEFGRWSKDVRGVDLGNAQ